jgi:hypothetical protein
MHGATIKIYVKLSLWGINQQVTKVYRGVEVYGHAFLTSALEQSVSGFGHFIPGEVLPPPNREKV